MNKNLKALADAQKARQFSKHNKFAPARISENLSKPAAAAATDTAQAVEVFSSPSASIDAGGLISENVALRMQQAAAGVPPAAYYPTKGTEMENANIESQVDKAEIEMAEAFRPTRFNHIFVNMAFTLNLGDPRMSDTKASLSSVPIKGSEYNLYSPFRKSGGKADELGGQGIVRAVLDRALDTTDTINNSRIVFLGDKTNISETLHSAIDTTRQSIQGMFPEKPTHVLFDVTDDGVTPAVVDSILISDVVSLRSWVNTPKDPATQIVVNNAILNFVVNAGALYDSPDKLKYITQVQTVLNLIMKNRGDSCSTNIVLAVALPAMLLATQQFRDLIGDLIEEHQYVLYSRMELENLEDDDSGFMPQCLDDVGKLLPTHCDLLLMKLIGEEIKSDAESA